MKTGITAAVGYCPLRVYALSYNIKGNGKIVYRGKIVYMSTGTIVFTKNEALSNCLH